jgi:adenine/guanine phosphoribosyltransferase-like PRPP-binding protein
VTTGTHSARIGSQQVELPIIPVGDDLAISLLMTIDMGVAFNTRAGVELAELLAPAQPHCVVSVATLGIPVAVEVSRALGLDDYVVIQKSPKVHLGDALRESVDSITSTSAQQLMLDRRRLPLVAGRRVALVDDVISTGGSIGAALRLLDAAGADVVAIGALLREGEGWREALGSRADLVRTLGEIPLFEPDPTGGWRPRPAS